MPSIRFVRSLWFVFALACCGAPVAFAQSVMADFQRAHKFYRAGQYRQAVRILQKILKKYPDHQPSHLVIGRIAFANGQIAIAAKHFRRISVEMVTPELAYEFGIVMFQANQCNKAVVGFARVQPNDRALDLSYFYRGICYLRGRETQRAIAYLRRAQKLPPNLQESRRQALAEARRRLKAEQQGRNPDYHRYLVVPTPLLPTGGAEPPPALAGTGSKSPPPSPSPPAATSGFEHSVTPSVTASQSSKTEDYFGYKVDNSESTQTETKLSLSGKYNFAPNSTGKQTYVQVPVNLSQNDESNAGNTTGYITYADDPGTVIEQESNLRSGSSSSFTVSLAPEVGIPLAAVQIAGGYQYEMSLPNGNMEKKSGSKTPYANVSMSFGSLTAQVTGNVKEAFNSDDAAVRQENTVGGKVSFDFETLDFSLAGQQTMISPGPAGKDAPPKQESTLQFEGTITKSWDSLNVSLVANEWAQTLVPGQIENPDRREMTHRKLSATADLAFDFGASLSLTVAMINKLDFRQTFPEKVGVVDAPPALQEPSAAEPPKKLISADGNDQQMVVAFKLAPFEWLFVQMSYDYQNRAYNLRDQSYLEDFQNANPEVVTEFKVTVGFSKTF